MPQSGRRRTGIPKFRRSNLLTCFFAFAGQPLFFFEFGSAAILAHCLFVRLLGVLRLQGLLVRFGDIRLGAPAKECAKHQNDSYELHCWPKPHIGNGMFRSIVPV